MTLRHQSKPLSVMNSATCDLPETLLATRNLESKGAPDPKHHGQALRSAMKDEWIQSEINGLWRRGIFQKVLRSSLTLQDRVVTSRFYYKIKRKEGGFDRCTVRLVGQGQHMRRKGEDDVGDSNDAFSPVLAARGRYICLFG